MTTPADEDRVSRMFREPQELAQAVRESVRAVVREYAAAQLLMPGWRNGRIVWVDPVTLQETEARPRANAVS